MRALLIAIVIWAWLQGTAHAAYANAAPPAGWSAVPVPSGTERGMYRAAANESWTSANTVRTTSTLNVGGRASTMSAGMRMAANAPRFMARAMFPHPLILLGAIALPYAYDWAAENNFFRNTTNTGWDLEIPVPSSCAAYSGGGPPAYPTGSNSWTWGCYAMGVQGFSYWAWSCDTCGYAYYLPFEQATVTGGSTTRRPATAQEFEDALAPTTMPWQVPNEFPGVEIPVGLPSLNPGADPAMAPSPWRVPLGEPVPVPNTNPQEYRQPVADVVPKPTISEPWRVDVQPKDVTGTDPEGMPEPSTPPEGTTSEPSTDEDLCALHPEILACAKLGDAPSAETLGTETKTMSVESQSGWGIGSASCPAAKSITVQGKTLQFSISTLCSFAAGIRPILVGMAYISSLLIFFGIARKSL